MTRLRQHDQRRTGRGHAACRAGAFSLLELMIGIVILGLGMVMVATMFPVAWGRARMLGEFTVERAITGNAHAIVGSLVRVSGPSGIGSSFESDLLFKSQIPPGDTSLPFLPLVPIAECPAFASDTFVHALNLENVQVVDRKFITEDLWRRNGGLLDLAFGSFVGFPVVETSFFQKRISFLERIYPPMGVRDNVNPATGVFIGDDDRWDDALATRRHCWAVFYRLRELMSYDPAGPGAPGSVRSFDMYYVTLRRGQSSFRYARQDAAISSLPNPCTLFAPLAVPAAMGPDNDVMFPIPWRVQVEFPGNLVLKASASGIPTEIEVPAQGASAKTQALLVPMFQRGTRFIDTISGQVYRVMDRRVSAAADKATLTLDREVFIEDIDLPIVFAGDPWSTMCGVGACDFFVNANLMPPELIRTVWVFPPPVELRAKDDDPLVFNGSQPVIGINVRTLNVAPTN